MNTAPERSRLPVDYARALSERALRGAGWDAAQSAVLADHMLDAALCGYEYSGLPKILNIAEYRAHHGAPRPPQVLHETPMSCRLDGGGDCGMLTVHHATGIAIDKALATGFAVVGVNHSYMSGRGAYYMERIARAGLVGIHAVSSRPQVAPPGGSRAAVGTNPVSFGFPTEGDPLLIDLGTSALMFTDLALRVRRGEPLPPGVAIDAQGQPTTDPAEAMLGAALPFGGHKGFALAVAMVGFGVLAGSADDPSHAGYVVMALRPDLMVPLAAYRRDLGAALERLRSTPRQPGVDAIRIPSERSFAQRAQHLREGIEIDRAVHDALDALGRRAGG